MFPSSGKGRAFYQSPAAAQGQKRLVPTLQAPVIAHHFRHNLGKYISYQLRVQIAGCALGANGFEFPGFTVRVHGIEAVGSLELPDLVRQLKPACQQCHQLRIDLINLFSGFQQFGWNGCVRHFYPLVFPRARLVLMDFS